MPDAERRRRGARRRFRPSAASVACLDDDALDAAGRRRPGASSATSARHQDIEWAIARDGTATLFVVQARPVTAAGQEAGEAQAGVGDVADHEHVRRRPAKD